MLAVLAYTPSSFECLEQYSYFVAHFAKVPSVAGSHVFCANLAKLQELQRQCPFCEVTPLFDVDVGSLVSKPLQVRGELQTKKGWYTCQEVLCTAKDPLPGLSQIPASTDLRVSGLIPLARDQETCGSCWSFALSGAFENAMLLDGVWGDARSIDVSEQFIMSNLRGFNRGCSGGDSIAALGYIIENPQEFQTVEQEANFPYDPMSIKTGIKPKLAQEQFVLPFKTFPIVQAYVNSVSEAAAISLMRSNGKFSANAVKQYLARGIAVIAAMSTHVSQSSQFVLTSYNGNALLSGFPCDGAALDHQVLIVGYGQYKGTSAWLVRNSWGSAWGNYGAFYVAEGKNDFCIEEYAYAIIPRDYDTASTTLAHEQSRPTPYRIERGITGFDQDNGEYITIHEINWTVIIVSIVCGFICATIAAILITCCVLKWRAHSNVTAGLTR